MPTAKLKVLAYALAGLGAALIVFFAAGVPAFLWWFAPSMCGNRIAQTVPSPDGSKKAIVFQRDCGATTGFSSQVSILPIHAELPNDSGNAFIARGEGGRGEPGLTMGWQSPTQLLIGQQGDQPPLWISSGTDGVRIIFERSQ